MQCQYYYQTYIFTDNPSYFSLPNGQKHIDRSENLSSASESSLTRHLGSATDKHVQHDKRFFLRSVSSNSADSNQELLILGEPRLSDIAPDLIMKHCPKRSNSLKNDRQKRSDIHFDLSYIPLPTSEEQADDLSEDEVFISEDSARLVRFEYNTYNCCSTLIKLVCPVTYILQVRLYCTSI